MRHLVRTSYLYSLLFLFVFNGSLRAQGQSTPDSTKTAFNFKQAPWYARSVPFSIYTGAGKTSDRVAQTIEIGKTFDVIDLGVAFGRNSLRPDTTLFLEARVTMDVANYGIFANEMALGAGRVFDSKGSLMLELTYNIFAQISPKVGFGLTTGYYDFSNDTFDSSKTFYGFILRYGLQRTDSGGIVGLGRGGRRIRARHVHR
ncbi:hypothetical protein GCM10028818_47160 [Spirosoma horti]